MESQSDEYLASVVHEGDLDRKATAFRVLWERYEQALVRFTASRLKGDVATAEEVVQDTWLAFANVAERQGITHSVRGLLYQIARRRIIDERRKIAPEWHIEHDIPLNSTVEEAYIEAEEQATATMLPFVMAKLSPCERAVWTLRMSQEFSTGAVARILGKRKGTISSALHTAHQKWNEYRSEMDAENIVSEALVQAPRYYHRPEGAIIERFSCALTPELTDEELQPLGISAEQLQNSYTISLAVPRIRLSNTLLDAEVQRVSLLIHPNYGSVPRLLEIMAELTTILRRGLGFGDAEHTTKLVHIYQQLYPVAPVEAMVTVDVDKDDNIILTPSNYLYTAPYLDRLLYDAQVLDTARLDSEQLVQLKQCGHVSLHATKTYVPILPQVRVPIDPANHQFLTDIADMEVTIDDEWKKFEAGEHDTFSDGDDTDTLV